MSIDHTLDSKEERHRIVQSRGRILLTGNSKQRRVLPAAEDISHETILQQKIALNMSRSLGHSTLCKYGGESQQNGLS